MKPWASRAGRGVFINHEASRHSNDCYVCEIPAGAKLEPRRQIFEEMILILSGRGSTSCANNAGQGVTFEWKGRRDLRDPAELLASAFQRLRRAPARFVAVTFAPSVINMYDDLDFVFGNSHDFKKRFSGEPDYFSTKGEQNGFLLQTNFVPDAVNLPLIAAKERGAGGGHIRFNMARGALASHISQFPVGTYKKAHKHGPGAHVIVLSGEGYSLMWGEGEEPERYDWEIGTLIVPPNATFHQHFNSGADAGALSGVQAQFAAQQTGRADVVDQPSTRRQPDRLCRRNSRCEKDIHRRACEDMACSRAWAKLTRGNWKHCRQRAKSPRDWRAST